MTSVLTAHGGKILPKSLQCRKNRPYHFETVSLTSSRHKQINKWYICNKLWLYTIFVVR